MEVIYEAPSCKAVYKAENKRIHFEFNGYMNFEQATDMYKTVAEFMKSNQVQSFFNDLRELKGTFTKLTTWLFENMAGVVSLGLKYDALVLNNDVFSQFAAEDFAKKITVLDFQIFHSMSDAEQWLLEREQ